MGENERKKRNKMFMLAGAVLMVVVVGLMISSRELPESMEEIKVASNHYIQAVRKGETEKTYSMHPTTYDDPGDAVYQKVKDAGFVALDEVVVDERNENACVGGTIGDDDVVKVSSTRIRIYMVNEGGWKVETLQVFDSMKPDRPPWPNGWSGAKLRNEFTCGEGY